MNFIARFEQVKTMYCTIIKVIVRPGRLSEGFIDIENFSHRKNDRHEVLDASGEWL